MFWCGHLNVACGNQQRVQETQKGPLWEAGQERPESSSQLRWQRVDSEDHAGHRVCGCWTVLQTGKGSTKRRVRPVKPLHATSHPRAPSRPHPFLPGKARATFCCLHHRHKRPWSSPLSLKDNSWWLEGPLVGQGIDGETRVVIWRCCFWH